MSGDDQHGLGRDPEPARQSPSARPPFVASVRRIPLHEEIGPSAVGNEQRGQYAVIRTQPSALLKAKCGLCRLTLVAPRIQAPRTRAQLRDQQRSTQHGHILHEHDLLHLRHHGIRHSPESMQRQSDRHQKEHDQPSAKLSAIAQQDAQAAGGGQDPREWDGNRSQRNSCEAAYPIVCLEKWPIPANMKIRA
jgi:hypothetical protein